MKIEEESRLYYVGITRVGETLTLFHRFDCGNPHLPLVAPSCFTHLVEPVVSERLHEILCRRYDLITFSDLYLDFAGHYPVGARIHKALAQLQAGDQVQFHTKYGLSGEESICILNSSSDTVARLSLE